MNRNKIQKYLDFIKEVDKMVQENIKEEDFENYYNVYLFTSIIELNGIFSKTNNTNQTKDNLNNIQDDCLEYHEKLRDTLKKS